MSVIRNKTVDIIISDVPEEDYKENGLYGYMVVCKQSVPYEGTGIITIYTSTHGVGDNTLGFVRGWRRRKTRMI